MPILRIGNLASEASIPVAAVLYLYRRGTSIYVRITGGDAERFDYHTEDEARQAFQKATEQLDSDFT